MRVLHAPVNVGNQPWVLSRFERELGLRSDLVVNYSTWLGYPADRAISPAGERTLGAVLRRLWYGIRAPWQYDVLHFYFARSLLCWDDFGPRNPLWFLDLHLARGLGRRIVFTLQGCDVRLAAESDRVNDVTMCRVGGCTAVNQCLARIDRQRRWFIQRILPRCHQVFVLNPELMRYAPKASFLPYASVDIETFSVVPPRTEGPIRILHAPTDPGIKGTVRILDALERLRGEFRLEILRVQNVRHAQALARYSDADLLVDQVYAGWYGGLAVELMAMGKPVACYIRDEDLACLPAEMRQDLPILRIHPDRLYEDLKGILLARELWPEWSRLSRRYVMRWHNPRWLARLVARTYAGEQFVLAPAPDAPPPQPLSAGGTD